MSALPPVYDVLVLTAADDIQAAGYRAQLARRVEQGLLPAGLEWRVVVDPGQPESGNRRIGSGGSTLAVLAELAATSPTGGRTLAERFQGRNVLIVHSGGESRRLPAYAAQGKIFLPMPCEVRAPDAPPWERHPAALFDLLWQIMTDLPRAAAGQIVICSGDVLPVCDTSHWTEAAADFGANSVTGLAFAATPQVARNHGVYVTDATGRQVSWGLWPVADFLQKPSLDQLQTSGALDAAGYALIDTGVLRLSPIAAAELLQAAGVRCSARGVQVGKGLYDDVLHNRVPLVDVYREIALALQPDLGSDRYLELVSPNASPVARKSLTRFYEAMRAANIAFQVVVAPDGEFFHVGTTRDLLTRYAAPSRTSRRFGFAVRQTAGETEGVGDVTFFNSTGSFNRLKLGGKAYLEACELGSGKNPFQLAGDNVLVGLHARDVTTVWKLPAGVGLAYLPFHSAAGETVRIPAFFGADDDNKSDLEKGGATFLGQPLQTLIDSGIPAELLWPEGGERSVWTSRLWMVPEAGQTEPCEAALRLLLSVIDGHNAAARRHKAAVALTELWRQATRIDWAQLTAGIDYAELLREQERIAAHQACDRIPADLLRFDDFPSAEACARVQRAGVTPANQIGRLDNIMRAMQQGLHQASPLAQARWYQTVSMLAKSLDPQQVVTGHAAKNFENAAYAAVARVVESAVELPHEATPAAILQDQAVWVTAPARIDFAGGWSDTPPICIERGGTVLNAAVTLNRQYPVQVVAKMNEEYCIRLTSIDLGQQEVYRTAAEINRAPDLGHWSSLARMALVIAGIVPERTDDGNRGPQSLRAWLETLGGGLDLTVFSGLPKGSGLGTSSILGSATLACLGRVVGRPVSPLDLIAQTSLLEQRMTSGGGWQDQVGGIIPGVKLSRTQAGIEQLPAIQWTVFGGVGPSEEALQRRMLLYFTGHKRLAKNILQNVVKRYLAREPEVLRIITRLKQGAEEAKEALEAGDLDAFAARVAEYWELKKAIDPESTNAEIEGVMAQVSRYTAATSLCGAGGGGFMVLIGRDEEATANIRRILEGAPANEHARFFDFALDNQGLAVTVL